MKLKTIIFSLVMLVLAVVSFFVFGTESGVMMSMALVGGPFRELKWGGITFRPTKDGEPETELSGNDYEFEASPNGDDYATAEAKVGYIQQECAMTQDEFNIFIALKDGVKRSGVATASNGDVLSLDCGISGEHILSGGKVTVKLAGRVELQ